MTQTLELQKSYGQGSGLAVTYFKCRSSTEALWFFKFSLRDGGCFLVVASSSIQSLLWMMMRTDALRLECNSFIDSIVLEEL